jgi:hypothetical protein
VSEEKKERKPLLEALASVTDGLDVLVGLVKEKKEEKKEEKPEERKAPDTFSGLLQSMVPLLIIPQILPLFQQALGQTLQSTTVNVKVESATALIPISIEATTVIMPIEIRASQVTLNVAIKQSDVTLKISIENSVVTLDVRVTNTSLNVVVTNSSLNVVVTNSSLDVRITNTSLNVVVTNSSLNVVVTNSSLNVTVVGDASIIISGQNVGVALTGTWQTFLGYNKVFWFEGQIPGIPYLTDKFANTLLQYTVPANRELYVESINFNLISRIVLSWGNVYNTGAGYDIEYLGSPLVEFFVYIGNTIVAKIALNGNSPSTVYQPITPLKVTSGTTIRIVGIGAIYGCWSSVTVLGYEKTI